MKKVSKAILIGFAVLVALAVALVASLNLYVQSPGSQARIQEELSKLLRMPLKLTNVSVSPFGSLKITGITIPNGDANFLEATSFHAHYRLLPLLQSKLVITEMSVESPKVVLAQSADGKWKLPEPEQAAKIARENPPSAAEKKPAEEKKSGFSVLVERFDVKGGAVNLLDKDLKPVAAFSDVNMVCTTLAAGHIAGQTTIGKLVWAGAFTLENVTGPFDYTGDALNLPEITAAFAGGTLQGKYQTHPEAGRSPYKIVVSFEKVDIDRLATQSGAPPGQTTGLLSGQFEVLGDSREPDRLDGAARADLRDGQFHQLDLFQRIGQALDLRELADLRVRDGHGDFRISGNKIFVDKIILNAGDLALTAHGVAKMDKRLTLAAQLSADDALVRHLGSIGDHFTPIDGGRRAIDFDITGSIDKLKTNLLDKLIGEKINVQLGDLLQGVFGGPRKPDSEPKKDDKKQEKDRKKKDKEKGPAPTATPDTTAPSPALPPAETPPPPPPPQPQPQPATPNP